MYVNNKREQVIKERDLIITLLKKDIWSVNKKWKNIFSKNNWNVERIGEYISIRVEKSK